MVTFSCTWVSSGSNGTVDSGTGAFCGATGSLCCVPQSCPGGWAEVGTPYVVTDSVACPGQGNLGCQWESTDSRYHPVAAGRVVRTCVKN